MAEIGLILVQAAQLILYLTTKKATGSKLSIAVWILLVVFKLTIMLLNMYQGNGLQFSQLLSGLWIEVIGLSIAIFLYQKEKSHSKE